LPLSQAINRILHGVSYVCIFDSKGNVEKIISFSNADKINESPFHKTVQLRRFSYQEGVQITPSHGMEDIINAMEIMPPAEMPKTLEKIRKYGPAPEMDETGENMEITAQPEGVDHMVESMGNIPY
jgi:hypothetical protein